MSENWMHLNLMMISSLVSPKVTGCAFNLFFQRMDVHGRERKLAGNNGEFSYSKAKDIFLINPNPPHNSSLSTLKSPDHNKLCKYWMSGHCHRGDKCWYLRSWSRGDGFTMLAKLEGHKKTIRGPSFRA